MRGVLRAISGNVRGLECPGRAGTYLPSLDDAEPGHAQRRHDTHIHDLRRRFKRDLAPLGPLALAMNRNAIMAAKRANARLGPTVAAAPLGVRATEKNDGRRAGGRAAR